MSMCPRTVSAVVFILSLSTSLSGCMERQELHTFTRSSSTSAPTRDASDATPTLQSLIPLATEKTITGQFGIGTGQTGVVNMATSVAVISPGGLATVLGTGLANGSEDAKAYLSQNLAGTTVTFDGSPAWLISVTPTRISLLVPDNVVNGGTAEIRKGGVVAATTRYTVLPVAPGIFTYNDQGTGPAKAQGWYRSKNTNTTNADGSYHAIDEGTEADPAYLILYGTGIRNHTQPVRASLGGLNAIASYAGAAGSYVGLDQINVKIPPTLATGVMDFTVTVDGVVSNTFKICVGAHGTDGKCGTAPGNPDPVNPNPDPNPNPGGASPGPWALTLIQGTGQVQAEQWPFGEDLIVKLTDANGRPVPNTHVNWTAAFGDSGYFTARVSDTVTDANGFASNQARAGGIQRQQPATTLRASVTAPNGVLTRDFFMTTLPGVNWGISQPGFALNAPEAASATLHVKAGETLVGAIQMSFNFFGGFMQGPLPNIGLHVWVDADNIFGITAACAGPGAPFGTALSDAKGVVTCDLKVGPKKGQTILHVRRGGYATFDAMQLVVE